MEIGRLIAVFEADTSKFESGAKRVKGQMQQVADSVTASQKRIGSGELSLAQQLRASESLQRQRSRAIIQQWKEQEKAALAAATGAKPFREVLQGLSTNIANLQGPLGAASGRVSSLTTLFGGLSGGAAAAGLGLGAVAAATAAAAVGIFQLTKSVTSSVDAIGDMAAKVNFSVRTLSGLETAIKASGGSIDGLATALGIFNQNLEKAAQGEERIKKLFDGLKISATDNELALRQVADVLVKLGGTSQQTALSMELFGRSGKDVLGIIKETGGDIDGFIKRMEALGIVIDEEGVKKADAFDRQMTIVSAQLDSLKRQLGLEFAPTITEVAQNTSNWLRDNQGELRKTITELANLTKEVVGFARFINSITPLQLELRLIRSVSGFFGQLLPERREITEAERERSLFTIDPNTGRRTYQGRQPFNEPGEFAVPFGRPAEGTPDARNALADQVRRLLGRGAGGGGGRGGGRVSDPLQALKESLVSLHADFRRFNTDLLDSANASALAAEKERLLSDVMRSLGENTRLSIAQIKDVDAALEKAIGALPKNAQAAARSLVEQSVAQFKANEQLRIAGDLNRRAEALTRTWRVEIDNTRSGADQYTSQIQELEKAFAKYNLTLDAGTRSELNYLTTLQRVLSATRERVTVLAQTRPRVVGEDVLQDLGGGSLIFRGEATRPRIATVEEQVARERLEMIRAQMRDLATDLTSTLDRAIYDGLQGGLKRGLASVAIGILDIVKNNFLRQLEESLSQTLQGVSVRGSGGGGFGGFLSNIFGSLFRLIQQPRQQTINLGGGSTYTPGGTGATRPRTVTPFVFDDRRIVDSVTGSGDRTVDSLHELGHVFAQQSQLNAQTIIAGLTPRRPGFLSGLLQAVAGGAASGAASGFLGGLFEPEPPPQPRASGGPIKAGQPYVVGERGKELFVSDTDGRIVPNNQIQNFYQQISNQIVREISAPATSLQDRMKDLQVKVSVTPERQESGIREVQQRIEKSLKESSATKQILSSERTNNFHQEIIDNLTKEISRVTEYIPADPREPQINVSLTSPKTPERLHDRLEKFREKISERLIMAPSRQYGGPVAAGQVYRIHDQEYFTPLQPGTIYNQQQINNSKAGEVHYHFNNTFNLPKVAESYTTPKSRRQLVESIAATMQQQLR